MSIHRFHVSRRSFIKGAAIGAAGIPAWFVARESAMAAPEPGAVALNDRPGVLLVGCGGQGRGDANNATRFGDIVAVCDVDRNHGESAAKQFTKSGKAPQVYQDFRKAMEHPGVDVVITGTPDHWHTLVNLAAIKAGKDIYSEKPLTLTIDEGKHLVEAVRKNKRILQTGSQQRSDTRFRLACELVRNGRIGKLEEVIVYLPAGLRGGPFQASPVPPELDWDRWLGQAPKVDYVRERCHVTFRYWFDYSGGTMTDWGAHHNDIARWAIGLDAPVAIEGKALAEPVPGGYTAFSEYEVHYTYANGVRHTIHTTTADSIYGGVVKRDGQRNGLKFVGSDGWIWVTRGDLQASHDEMLSTPLPDNAQRLYLSNDHMRNFFECIRSRKAPVCDVETGHRSASVCHLGVIALRLGRPLKWDPTVQRFTGEGAPEANRWLGREMRAPYDYSFVA